MPDFLSNGMSIHCSWSPFQSYHDIFLRNTNALSFCQFLWTLLFHMLLPLLHYSLRHSNILCEVRGFQKHTWRGAEYFLFHSLETNSFCRKLRFPVRHSCFFGWFQGKRSRYSFCPQRRSRRLSYSDFWLCGRNNLVQLLCKAGIRRRLKTAAPLGHSYGDTEVDYLLSRWEQVQPFPLAKSLLFLSLLRFNEVKVWFLPYGVTLCISLGKSSASLIFSSPISFWTNLATPSPNPPSSGIPYLKASK